MKLGYVLFVLSFVLTALPVDAEDNIDKALLFDSDVLRWQENSNSFYSTYSTNDFRGVLKELEQGPQMTIFEVNFNSGRLCSFIEPIFDWPKDSKPILGAVGGLSWIFK